MEYELREIDEITKNEIVDQIDNISVLCNMFDHDIFVDFSLREISISMYTPSAYTSSFFKAFNSERKLSFHFVVQSNGRRKLRSINFWYAKSQIDSYKLVNESKTIKLLCGKLSRPIQLFIESIGKNDDYVIKEMK